jgi:ankyrin repeat protein
VVARYLLDNGADVNVQAPNNPTPLYKAAAAGHRAMVELLLTHGANIDAANVAGQTPLYIAGRAGFKAVVEVLLAHNAKVDAAASRGDTALHDAAGGGMKGIAQVLLDHGADPNSRDRYGSTPLHYAARNGHADLVELLLAHQADINAKDWGVASPGLFPKEGNPRGATPLVVAIIQKQTDSVKLLLAHKADISIECEASFETSEQGPQIPFPQRRGNALYMAVGRGDPGLVNLLLQANANPNSPAAIGKKDGFVPSTPLLLAIGNGPEEIVRSLLAAKADANVPDETGATPLYNAVVGRDSTSLVALLLDHGAEVNARNHEGKTPLWVACQLGRVSMASQLLDHRADPNLAPPDGNTPLDWACRYRDKDLAQLLLDKGANPNLRNQQGITPLDELKWNYGLPGGHAQPVQSNDLASLLLLHGAVTDFPRLDRIELRRPASGFSQVVFSQGTNDHNHFTLMELIAVHYGFVAVSPKQPSVVGGPLGGITDHEYSGSGFVRAGSLGFPNLEKILIRQPTPDGLSRTTVPVDLSALFRSGDCSRDPALQWGDIVELPEVDHPINAAWQGFSEEDRAALEKCLNRHVQLTIKGGTTNLALTLQTHTPGRASLSPVGFVYLGDPLPTFSLLPFLQSSGLLRASSDLSRVKVRRLDPATGQNLEWLFDCATPNAVPTFWLRDGDAVEVPEKP